LTLLAELQAQSGAADRSAATAELAISAARQAGDQISLPSALDILGLAERLRGAPQRSAALLEEAVRLHKRTQYKVNIGEALFRWADTLLTLGEVDRADELCIEGLRLLHEVGSPHRLAIGLRVAASVANARRDYERAVALLAAAEALHDRTAAPLSPTERADFDSALADDEQHLGATAIEAIRFRTVHRAAEDLVKEVIAT
jgi:tetratricopeptide (TPR) repeat protein